VELADELELTSISFPAISCGAYRYPPARAALVAISAAWQAAVGSDNVRVVRFVLFQDGMRKLYADEAASLGLAVAS
jgi:O-acetyl-ADP-ribose deacetylase